MRTISRLFRPRITHLIALAALTTTASCKDSTAPKQVEMVGAPNASLVLVADVDELGELSSSLDDMTGWSLASLPAGKGRENIVGILNGLKGHLQSRKIAACQEDVAAARTFLESLSEEQRVDIGAVGVTLDLIQATLDKASQ